MYNIEFSQFKLLTQLCIWNSIKSSKSTPILMILAKKLPTIHIWVELSLLCDFLSVGVFFKKGMPQYSWKNVLGFMETHQNNGRTQLLNCHWNSSDIDTCQLLKYQSSRDSVRIFIPEGLALIKFWFLSLIFSVLLSKTPKFRRG